MERRVGVRQTNPNGTVGEAMGDGSDHPRQIQWHHRIRSNKVGVEGGASAVPESARDEREEGVWAAGGSQSPLSAKLRSGSGSSQFREVDFSDQVQGVGSSAVRERPRYFAGGGSSSFSDDWKRRQEHEEEANPQELRVLKNGDEVGRVTVIKGNNAQRASEGPEGHRDNGLVVGEGAVRSAVELAGKVDQARRSVPLSLALGDDPPFSSSSGASTSHVPYYQASDDSFTTGGTATTAAEGVGGGGAGGAGGGTEAPAPSKLTRPPLQDEQEKPTLTPTSLAIYSSIQQRGSSRSGTCILFATAVCTFVVTLVLTVAILIAPKTLASRGEDPAARAAPALAAATTAANSSVAPTAPNAALRALTRVLGSVLGPNASSPSSPTASSILTTSEASSQVSHNTTELFRDALTAR